MTRARLYLLAGVALPLTLAAPAWSATQAEGAPPVATTGTATPANTPASGDLAPGPTVPSSTSAAPSPATSGPAADVAGGQGDDGALHEIVVTAQRRAENLQRVPIAVTAADASTLSKNGVTDTLEVQQLVPGLVMNKQFGGTNPFLRGIGTVSSGIGAEMSIATYLDGIYISNAGGGLFSLTNVNRIEVLKGPQGTLFGRNATGGVINVITLDPTQKTKVDASVGYSNYDTVNANLYAATGVSDDLAVSLASDFQNQGHGWGTNLQTGHKAFYFDQFGLQGKAKWTPGDRTTVTFTAFYNRVRTDLGSSLGIPEGERGIDGTPYLGRYTVNHLDSFATTHQLLFGNRIEHDMDWASLVNITGYTHLIERFLFAQNGIEGTLVPGQGATNIYANLQNDTITNETQLLSPKGNRFQWIVGAFVLRDIANTYAQDVFPTCINGICNAAPLPQETASRQLTTSFSFFGQGTYPIFDATRLTVGLRYTRDRKSLSGLVSPLAGYSTSVATLPASVIRYPGQPTATLPNGIPTSDVWPKVTWRFALDHDLVKNVLIYASYNRGFKSGVYNVTSFSNPPANPEVLDAYEAGVKSELFDRKLRLNLSAFYYDFKGIQLRTSAPPAPVGQAILFNAAVAHVKGIDGDYEFVPFRGFTLSGGFEILDGRYTSFPGRTCTALRAIGGTVLGGTMNVTCPAGDAKLIRAPNFSGVIGADYTFRTGVGAISLGVKDTHTSSYYFDPSNRIKQAPYDLLNAELTWTSPSKRYDVQLFARNLVNAFYSTVVLESAGGNDVYAPGDPRTYGVRVGVHF